MKYAYTESFPKYGPVEIIKHLVHVAAVLPHVEIAHNLNMRQREQRMTLHTMNMRTKNIFKTCIFYFTVYLSDFGMHRRSSMKEDRILHEILNA